MNIIRLFSLLTIFGLFYLSITGVSGAEDTIDADVDIGDEDEPTLPQEETVTASSDVGQDKEEEDPNQIPSSPDFQTVHIFTQPAKATELIAGKLTRLLVGTRNNGSQSFIVENIEASLRYPQDFTYYIQNFTTHRAEKMVEPGFESTFEYLFMPSETFNGRPMGLVVLINYRNGEGKRFQSTVFNQTINFIDSDEGFDSETFFLYIVLGGIVALISFVAYQYLSSLRLKRGSSSKQTSSYASGAQATKGSYDADWIPKHHLIQNRSPKKSQRKSRQNNDVNGAASSGAASSENDE